MCKQSSEQEISTRELQLIELEILKKFDAFCRKHDLKYIMSYGTLLGAVRHKGFIPWDDDVDILMPREDYLKLIEIFDDESLILGSPYTTLNWSYPYIKCMDPQIILDEQLIDAEPINAFIDIFPLDGLPDSRIKSAIHFFILKILKITLGLKVFPIAYTKSKMKRVIKSILAPIARILCDKERLIRRIDRLASKYPYESSNYVAHQALGYGYRERIEKRLMDQRIEMEFESGTFFAPAGYDQYLKNLFGNYMELPPAEERISNHIHKVWYKK